MPYLLDSNVPIDISSDRQESIDYVDTLADPDDIPGDRDGTPGRRERQAGGRTS
jgi:hypothetical protein